MFKQVKSAVFWYYLYKFRRKVLLISFLLIIVIFANAIYSDVVEYLTLKEKLEYLEFAILAKWFIIIFNILFSIYLVLTLFKKDNNEKKENKKEERKEEKFTAREEKFLNKKLKNKADMLVER